MTHPLEFVIAFGVAIIVVTTAVVSPRPKPEPPAEPQKSPIELALEDCKAHPENICYVEAVPVVRVEPQTKEQKQIQSVRQQIKTVSERAARIEKLLDERADEK